MTRRAFNFSAGPAALPTSVLERAQRELLDFEGTGMSFLELSHRDAGGPVQRTLSAVETNLRLLLHVPDDYAVLLGHGGAHAQFAAVPLHLLGRGQRAGFVRTGFWSERAQQEADRFGSTFVAASAEERDGKLALPARDAWDVPADAAYLHLCANETIGGLEYLDDPEPPPGVPLVADFTSTLLSRPVDVSRYGVIYASGGKNLGPSGFVVVIVRRDLLDRRGPHPIPSILDWRAAASTTPIPSIVNTPATFPLYLSSLVLEDLLARGGLEAAEQRAIDRARKVYAALDASDGFYVNDVLPAHRSRMNVPFTIGSDRPGARPRDRDLERRFTRDAEARGLFQVFGHPLFGGQRITLYGGIPDEAVDAVTDFLVEFAKQHA